MLLSASVHSRREQTRGHAEQLMQRVDWAHLAATLSARRLLPMLGPRIEGMAPEGLPPGQFARATAEAIESNRRHAMFLQLVSTSVTDALCGQGIRCTQLKGATFGEAIYGDCGRRQSSDVDLLVAPDELRAAVDVVRGLGYRPPTDYVDSSGLPKLHFSLVHEEHKLPPIELHWRVHYYDRRFACERMLAPVRQPPADWRPEPIDELVALLLFYARDGFIDLRLATDLSAWWDVRGTGVEPGMLDELLTTYPDLRRVVAAAVTVAEKIVGLPSERLFADPPVFGVRSRLAVRLANPNPRHISQAQLYADIGLLDGLLSPLGGFRAFARRQLLLPRELLEELDRRSPKRRARSAVGRTVGMLGRFALTMARVTLAPRERLAPLPSQPSSFASRGRQPRATKRS
jgi:hypothetical protein